MRRSVLALSLSLALGLGTVACTDDDDDQPPDDGARTTTTLEALDGGSLVVALESEPDGLDPTQGLFGVSTMSAALAVFDPLFVRSADDEVVPYLAASISGTVDEGRWSLRLRPDVVFSDGTSLDAAAVASSFDRVLDSPLLRRALADVQAVQVVDDLGVDVRTAPGTDLPALLTGQLGLVSAPTMTDPRSPVGTGPFVVDEWVPGDHLTLRRNDRFWRRDEGLPHLDALELRWDPAAPGVDVAVHDDPAGEGRSTVLVMNPDRAPFDDAECADALDADTCDRDAFVVRTAAPASVTDALVEGWRQDGLSVTVEPLDAGALAVAELLGDFDAIVRDDDGLLDVDRRAEGDVITRVLTTSGWRFDVAEGVGGRVDVVALPGGSGETAPQPGVLLPVALARAAS